MEKRSIPKRKHETLCNDYKAGGLKNVDISNKIIALQCSWIKRLYDNSFHEWKLIPFSLIQKSSGRSFKFHSNHLAVMTEILPCILPQYLRYNSNIQ